MEERSLNEKESLELITQMIRNSKKNLQLETGNVLLLWGYLCTITALAAYILVKTTDNPTWNFIWFAIPVIGYPIWYWQIKKKVKPVLSYTDKILQTIWKIIGQYGLFLSLICSLYFNTLPLMLPITLMLCSLGMCITGSIINDKFIYNCSGIGVSVGVVMLSQLLNSAQIEFQYLGFAFCFFIMMILPGHRLNKEAKRTQTPQ